MANRIVRVTLAPGHEVTLTSDAPDIDALAKEIVKVRDSFNPEGVKVDCDLEGFDQASFREVVVQTTNDFIDAIRLDEEAYENALKELKDSVGNSRRAE